LIKLIWMRFSLGFSPCPNDCFIFDALVNKKIDTEGFEFDTSLEDVQTLNRWALEGKLDITKISYGVLPLITKNYDLLDSGGALGKGVGPLLIAKRPIALTDIPGCRIAVPGVNTTAHLLFSLAFPGALNKEFMIFSSIQDAVLSGDADAGVIIHENRFTYQEKGLIKLIDLGEFWETETGCPIPLGGIVARKPIDQKIQEKVNRLIRKSTEFAFSLYPVLPSFVKEHAQEMNEQVMRQHIDLYVNNYSITLGEDGKMAVDKLLEVYDYLHSSDKIPSSALI
jgi:1,4-dihydroxy-6-naphthoate synthase